MQTHLKHVSIADIKGLPFKMEPFNYVYYSEGSQSLKHKIMFETDVDTLTKVTEAFKGKDTVQIKEGDKVYVLPGSSLPAERLKSYLKRVGANLTVNIQIATIILGNEKLYGKSLNNSSDSQPSHKHSLHRVVSHYRMTALAPSTLRLGFEELNTAPILTELMYDDYRNLNIQTRLAARARSELYNDDNHEYVYDTYWLTAQMAEALYTVLLNKIPIMSDAALSEVANSEIDLEDDEVYESICQLLGASSKEDRDLGMQMLLNADLSGDIHYKLWKINSKYQSVFFMTNHSKALVYYKRQSKFGDFYNMNSTMYLEKFSENMSYSEIKSILGEVLENQAHVGCDEDDPFFYSVVDKQNFTHTIMLKEKWVSLLKSKDPVQIDT